MDTFASEIPAVPHNEPRDLLQRLYREIGISAVAAALEISDAVSVEPRNDLGTRDDRSRQAA